MATAKYLYVDGTTGLLTSATGAITSTADAIVALDGTGKLNINMMPEGTAADTATITAGAALAAGDFVNIYDDAGTPKVRKADATSGTFKEAHGFVKAAVLLGDPATVYFSGPISITGTFTAGQEIYLSTTPGGVVTTAPSGGDYVQSLGVSRETKTTAATAIGVNIARAVKS